MVSSFCGRLIEACWLVAAGVLQLLMDPLAADKFLPLKTGLLNSVGLLVAAALSVRLVEQLARKRSGVPFWAVAAAVLLACHGLSMTASLNWRDSLWGGDAFLHGGMALFCQLSLFAGVACRLRRPEQVRRLVAVILAASLPMALHALYQRFGWDPLSQEEGKHILTSFAGNATFAAGSLLFAIPLCAWKLASAMREARDLKGAVLRAAAACYAILLVVQIAALISTGKRGPFLGLLAAAGCAAVLNSIHTRRFRRALAAIALTGALVLGLAGLAVLAREKPSIKENPLVKRLAMIVPVGTGTGDVFRKWVWEKAPAMTLRDSPMVFPDGQTDAKWRARPLVGYGQETLPAMFPQHVWMRGAAPGASIESRLHNSFWDTLQSVGFLGLAATLLMQAAVFSRGLAGMNLPKGRHQAWRLVATGTLLGIITGAAMELYFGKGYFGLGFPVGFAGGLLLWPLLTEWRCKKAVAASECGHSTSLIIAFIAALTAHWIDMCFAFPTANTSALAWIYSGAIVALGGRWMTSGDEREEIELTQGDRWFAAALLRGVLAGGMLAALCHAFITDFFPQATTAGEVVRQSLTLHLHNHEPSHLAARLLVPAWLGALLLLAAGEGKPRWRGYAVSAAASFMIAAAWTFWKAGKLADAGGFPIATTAPEEIIRSAIKLENLAIALYLYLLLMISLMAVLLHRTGGRVILRRPGTVTLVAAGIAASMFAFAIRATQLPAFAGQGSGVLAGRLGSLQQPQAAVEAHRRVLRHNPQNLFSRIDGSKAAMALAERSQDSAECLRAMRGAEEILQDGLRINNRNVLHYFHANVLMRQAFEMPEGTERQSTARRARAAYAAALVYAPNTEVAWFEASMVERSLLGDVAAADASLARADRIAGKVDPIIYGEQYSYQMRTTANPVLNPAYGRRGVEYFTRALEASEGLPAAENARLLIAKATLLVNLRQPSEARGFLLEATRLGETPDLWRAHAMLAELFLKAGDRDSAGPHLDEAIRLAPDEVGKNLRQLKSRVFRQPS